MRAGTLRRVLTDQPRPTQPARPERRALVLETAAALADAGGYDAVTMKSVADGSGVALATLYRWWASKDHLLAEALLVMIDELDASLRESALPVGVAADRLAAIMGRVGGFIAARPQAVGAAITALLSGDDTVLELTAEFHAAIERWIDLAAGDQPVAHRTDATELLEHVIFASLIALVRGIDTPASVQDRLERAARLLLV